MNSFHPEKTQATRASMIKWYRIIVILFLPMTFCSHAWSQVLHGTVTDTSGTPLPFATIYLPDERSGTATNAEGEYRIVLKPGWHRVAFQYLGFKTEERRVEMQSGDKQLDIQLRTQPVSLEEVKVTSDREDPAYTIMRKAIAKAKYHTQQLDSFTARVYIKGSGRLLGTPWLLRKQIEKAMAEEGMDSTTAFVTESVSEITYKRPNQYSEKVVSVRTIGEDNNTSPNSFIQSSFYEPEVNQAVSPLSPRAFAFYKFEYLGEFADQGHNINKIRVTPRSKGDNVFEGDIYIVDQVWSIHSLNLATFLWGIRFNINQVYAPIEPNVWLPVNNIYDVTGKVFGFSFEYRYFANTDDYKITLNPDLVFEPEIIDDKLQAEKAALADKQLETDDTDALFEQLSTGEEISRKQLRKIMREYEKQEQEHFEQQDDSLKGVYTVSNFTVDSSAHKRDSTYWSAVRPIPLTTYELKGYRVMDSIAVKESLEAEASDTLSLTMGSEPGVTVRSKSAFEPIDILLGGQYKISDGMGFRYESPLTNTLFNTVDGFNSRLGLRLLSRGNRKLVWSFGPDLRYAFSRKAFNYTLRSNFAFGKYRKQWEISVRGGEYVEQLNSANPISPAINSFTSLFLERNYMKLLARDFVEVAIEKAFTEKLSVRLTAALDENNPLENTSDYSVFESPRRDYTSNAPYNLPLDDVGFQPYRSFQLSGFILARPWLRYRIRNGNKQVIDNSSPTLSLQYRMGLDEVFHSEESFQQIELGFENDLTLTGGSIVNLKVAAGAFLDKGQLSFPDFKHFNGNLTFFANLDPVGHFRLLDYYTFSTDRQYLEVHAYYQMRKFLLTQFLWTRLAGVRESLFTSSLMTEEAMPYWEVGYSLNYLFRIFRIELAGSFLEDEFLDFGVRIGVATNFESLFGG